MITRLDDASARKIAAGQVITDLTSVVKELLENALDAAASTVTIRLRNFGMDEIVVEDDGSGIAVGPLVDPETGALRGGASTPLLSSRATTKQPQNEAANSAPEEGAHDAEMSVASRGKRPVLGTGSGTNSSGAGPSIDGEEETDPSLGFRGEALHSLAHLSDVVVETRSGDTGLYTVCLTYLPASHATQVEVTRNKDSRGTTVTARHLFQRLPVRHREFAKNHRKQLSRATSTVKQYAVSHPHIRLLLQHQESATSAVSTLVSLTGSGDPTRSMTEAYGGLCISHMQRVSWTLSFGTVSGLVSKVNGGGRLSGDHQVFALDGRLVDLPRLAKAVQDAFAQCLPNASQRLHVGFFLQIKTNPSLQYDVNLTPNKRKVLLAQEERLAEEVHQRALQEFSLASQEVELDRSQRIAQTQAVDVRATELTRLTRTPVSATSFTQFTFKRPKTEEAAEDGAEARRQRDSGSDEQQQLLHGGRRSGSAMDLPKLGRLLYAAADDEEGHTTGTDAGAREEAGLHATASSDCLLPSSSATSCATCGSEDECDGTGKAGSGVAPTEGSRVTEEDGVAVHKERLRGHSPSSSPCCCCSRGSAGSSGSGGDAAAARADAVEVTRLSDEGARQRHGGVCYPCSFPSLSELACEPLSATGAVPPPLEGAQPRTAAAAKHGRTLGAQTEEDLNLYFNKTSFKALRVIGQFNHGFIIAALPNGDVFVVDQHASDEKYNYERLVRGYEATPQPLVLPVSVAMDAHEVDLAVEHQAALQAHGFRVGCGGDDTKLLVYSLPVLPYDVVSATDVMELVQQLVQYGTITQPLRAVWHSMATKACRSSIMIGTPLTMPRMKLILERLGELDQPWNCPHGRPTMRLLGNMADLRRSGASSASPFFAPTSA